MSRLFEKYNIKVEAETSNNMILLDDKNPVVVKMKDPYITLKFNNDGLSIVEGKPISIEFSINEFNLCNAILDKIFNGVSVVEAEKDEDKHNVGQKIKMDGATARYLIKTSGCENEYVYEDGYLYSLYLNRIAVVERINDYIDRISSEEVKSINRTLVEMIKGLPEKETTQLVGNDLHFQSRKSYGKQVQPSLDKFGDVVPVFTCDRSKVSGLIKHLYNKIKKGETSNYDAIFAIALNSGYSVEQGDGHLILSKNGNQFDLKICEDGYVDLTSNSNGTILNLTHYNVIKSGLDILDSLN